ncbi:hypothetical protein CEXT_88481, partial [Caerostris extrusa]
MSEYSCQNSAVVRFSLANRGRVVSIGKILKAPMKGKARGNSFPFINWTDHYLSYGSRVFTWRRDLIQNQPPLRRTHPLRCVIEKTKAKLKLRESEAQLRDR